MVLKGVTRARIKDLRTRLRELEGTGLETDDPLTHTLMCDMMEELENVRDCYLEMLRQRERLLSPLRALVDLKEHRDRHGKTPEYQEAKPEAWAAARSVVRLYYPQQY